MGEAENKKLFNHYTSLVNGSHKSGNSVQNELVVSDAKKHLADLIKKNPELEVKKRVKKQEPVEQIEPVEPVGEQ